MSDRIWSNDEVKHEKIKYGLLKNRSFENGGLLDSVPGYCDLEQVI